MIMEICHGQGKYNLLEIILNKSSTYIKTMKSRLVQPSKLETQKKANSQLYSAWQLLERQKMHESCHRAVCITSHASFESDDSYESSPPTLESLNLWWNHRTESCSDQHAVFFLNRVDKVHLPTDRTNAE